jgi:hypothetical protein
MPAICPKPGARRDFVAPIVGLVRWINRQAAEAAEEEHG